MIQKSAEIKELSGAILVFHKSVGKVIKENTGGVFGNKYADLSSILDAIKTPLQEAKLVITQHPSGINELTTILVHTESGQYIESSYTLNPTKNDPQGQGSVITYARRYAIGAILGLNIDFDDDVQPVPTKKPITKETTAKKVEAKQKADVAPNDDFSL